MRKPPIICIVLAIVGALTASLAIAAPGTRTVSVGDNWFYAKTGVPKITVTRDTTVRFSFIGKKFHDVVGYRAGKKRFGPSPSKKSGYYRKKMNRTGLFTIICDIHGGDDQSMKIRVKE